MSNQITRREFVQAAAAFVPLSLTPAALRQSKTQVGAGDRFDVVVAGAGHNSLITACYLAKAGFRVVVLEGRPQIGGGTKTAELTLRGVHSDVCSCQHPAMYNHPVLKELKLADYGLEYIYPDPVRHTPFPDGSYITLWQDFDRTCEEIAKYSKKDAETYRRMANEAASMTATYGRTSPDPNLPIGWEKPEPSTRKLPAKWRRITALSRLEVLRRNFEDERTMVFMMSPWPTNCTHPFTGMAAYPSKTARTLWPKGGSGMLSVALGRCLEALGGVILTNKPVMQLIVEGGKCTGVECADGSAYRAARAVLSTVHIKRLVEMAPKEMWGEDFIEAVNTFQTGGASFNTHYATTEPVKYPVKGGTLAAGHSSTLSSVARALRWDNDLAVEHFDGVDPVLHIVQPSVHDPTRAPAGIHTVRILCDGAIYNLKNGGPARWEEIKEEISRAHLKAVQRNAPNFTDDKILARFIVTPVDTERMNPGMWHGSCHGGTDGPAQAGEMRPVPGWAQYRMPIQGLYQTGATTYPGGSVNGQPGRNAAMVMLKDLGTSFGAVIKKT